jgi:Domain of unknown function (DUF1996)
MRTFIAGALTALLVVFLPPATGGAVAGFGLLSGRGGIFVSGCPFSHRLPDDPIVKPALPGASHSHDFFGNTSTNAFSTYDTLRASGTTCDRDADRSGYWVPTLYDAGVAVQPATMWAYYTTRDKPPLAIKPFPAGLRIVAGNAYATGPQPMMVATWGCGDSASTESSSVPLCALGSLQLHVRFPDCWDGANLDFPDHKSHMAYSSYGHCPAGYGTSVPGLQINVTYPVRGGPTITLASGAAYTAHADFFNAWDQTELTRLVRDCLNFGLSCT